ncbi:hypothetical protein J8631_20835 [Serratia fonticola]|uniref:hypothetical protein n=1 Tax=Serratia fonticola TaxID=47917 RepID=UPI001AE4C65A|nr:hypothetical protein [Serratia fonticola]MBP1038021.1 hypothetical protein [Serratia fonticola]
MNVKKQELRNKIKGSQSLVMDAFDKNHKLDICFFCGSLDSLTKEHVIPQWVFDEKKEQGFFNATANDQPQKYIQATIPACECCNNVLLSSIEDYVKELLSERDGGDYSKAELDVIIWWLQSLEYKLQVLDLRRDFLKHKEGPFIPFLKDIPLGIMRNGASDEPYRILRGVRASRRELTKKRKSRKHNSLVVFKTTNKSMHFFHKTTSFIFLEMPQVGVAFFFFFKDEFSTIEEAHSKAMELIRQFY